jgi:hypothetical protein
MGAYLTLAKAERIKWQIHTRYGLSSELVQSKH